MFKILIVMLVFLFPIISYANENYAKFIHDSSDLKIGNLKKLCKISNNEYFDNSYAFIVSVGSYEFRDNRKFFEDSAEKLMNYLYNTGEYDKIIMLKDNDVTLDNMKYFLNNYLPKELTKKSRLIIFLNGAFYNRSAGKKYSTEYFALKNWSELNANIERIQIGELLEWIKKINVHHMLALFDYFPKDDRSFHTMGYLDYNFNDNLIKPLDLINKSGANLITSSGVKYLFKNDIIDWSASIFSDKLINGMDGKADNNDDGIVTASELFCYVSRVKEKDSFKIPNDPRLFPYRIHDIYGNGEYLFLLKDPDPYGLNFSGEKLKDAKIQMSKDENINDLIFADNWPPDLKKEDELIINHKKAKILEIDKDRFRIKLLGDFSMNNGLNILDHMKKKFLFWMEFKKLMKFEKPYKNSHAIIVAINDYDRINDVQKRGKTGFERLDNMVENAKQLKSVLLDTGFEEENIHTFFDQQATSSKINEMLRRFWEGAEYGDSDFLFLYFGGHGKKYGSNNGLLITYDYDKSKPTLTSISINDLTMSHAINVNCNHMLITLDACYSGLIFQSEPSQDKEDLKLFRKLSMIKADITPKARNILVAATGEEKAIWQNGGIFTKALLDGIKGDADYSEDGLIEFGELGSYVRSRVISESAALGIDQNPDYFRLTKHGKGRVIFVKPGFSF